MTQKRFYICSRCQEAIDYDGLPENMTTTSSEFPFCELGDGHFYQCSTSETDGRPTTESVTIEVVRNPVQDIVSSDPSQNRNGGDYDFTAWKVIK